MPGAEIVGVATHPERSEKDLTASYDAPPTRHAPLTGRNGATLGVEPVQRLRVADPEDTGVARRARLLAKNEWRSVPPPAA